MAKELWVEKYFVNAIDYVFKDIPQRKQVQNWITDGGIPHLSHSPLYWQNHFIKTSLMS